MPHIIIVLSFQECSIDQSESCIVTLHFVIENVTLWTADYCTAFTFVWNDS